MASKEIFKTVMRGYKKEEVVSYIADMSAQIENLKADLDKKDVELDRLQDELEQLNQVSSTPDEAAVEEIRAQIKAEMEQEYQVKLEAALAEKAQKAEKEKELGDIEKKAKEYDDCKETLASLMIEARKNAEDIIAKANMQAELLRAKSEAEYAGLCSNFAVLKQNVGGIRTELQQNLEKINEHIDAFDDQLTQLQKSVDKSAPVSVSETDNQ